MRTLTPVPFLAPILLLATASLALPALAKDEPHSISLVDAIEIAEHTQGGTALMAMTETEDGKTSHEVRLQMPDGSCLEVDLDAANGAVLETETGCSLSMADDDDGDESADDHDEDHDGDDD